MSSLDDKLRDILVKVVFAHDNDVRNYNAAVAAIKQAFVEAMDAMLDRPSFVAGLQEAAKEDGLMTGQEWYERYKQELNYYLAEVYGGEQDCTHYGTEQKPLPVIRAVEAAQRAAGLEGDTE